MRGVDPKGPAAKAGLRDGETVSSVDDPVDGAEPMKVDVEREGKTVTIAFKPSGGTKRGQAFKKKLGLSDDACKKLALRK